MIWYATTVDLMEKVTKRSVEELEHTNYLIMSSRIRTSIERDNVLNITNLFLNAGMLRGVGFTTESDSVLAREEFKNDLLKNTKGLSVLCSIVECSIIEGEDTIILCTPDELECNYMQVFAEVVSEIFKYPILRYPDEVMPDISEAIKRILYYRESIKKYALSKASLTDREKMLNNMSKKELKKELKKRALYSSGMDKEEMIEVLNEFY